MEYRRLRDIAISTQYGYTSEETSLVEGKYKYLRITDIVPYFVDFDRVPYCTIPNSKVNQYLVEEGDILVARTGATTGYNYVVGKDVKNTVFASYLIRFKIDEKQVEPTYLKYIMKSQMYYGFVKNYIGGSAQPGMNAKVFGRFNFPLPSLPLQRRIASILSAYDNLIEANSRRIKILEQMAENLYKEWFVRFRFPNYQNIPIENGIPKGWKVEKLKKITKRLPFNRLYKASDLEPEGDVIVIDQSTSAYLGFHNNEPSHYANIDDPIIIFGDHSCKFQLMIQNFSLGENVIPFISNDFNTIDNYFFYYATHKLIETEEYKRHWGRLMAMKILIPSISIQRAFSQIVKPIHSEIATLQTQSANLTRQRDLLLPRLMSGQLPTQ